ncbi:hypothetical protein ARMSODRAFT_155908 [Armillaria solidipes]|uniref:Uncharacterized protein n=1 Tax=Armillaria solidipes TaxID=1076256 RepID=A0A2H3AGZ6_9AGAR|nr:hypothetical protein ARMSODRAFT_155908 [Armillaria solidipes]
MLYYHRPGSAADDGTSNDPRPQECYARYPQLPLFRDSLKHSLAKRNTSPPMEHSYLTASGASAVAVKGRAPRSSILHTSARTQLCIWKHNHNTCSPPHLTGSCTRKTHHRGNCPNASWTSLGCMDLQISKFHSSSYPRKTRMFIITYHL